MKVHTEDRCLNSAENMHCHTVATVRNRKIRNEPIPRSILSYFHPVLNNIQAPPPQPVRTHFSKRWPMPLGTNFPKRTQAFATKNANLNCLFIAIDPLFRRARRLTYHKAVEYPMLIA